MTSNAEFEANEYERLCSLTNWGRWGPEDERGALNFVTPEVTLRALASVRLGEVYPLGAVIREHGSPVLSGFPAPMHLMNRTGGDWVGSHEKYRFANDTIVLRVHAATTHLDALCHRWIDDQIYNGFDMKTVRSTGADRNGIENVGGVVTRGLLIDVARLRTENVLPSDYLINVSDIVEWESTSGIAISSGDAVLLRTGWHAYYESDPVGYSGRQPGLAPSAALYLAEREVALVGADNTGVNAFKGWPPQADDRITELHVPMACRLGIPFLEMMDLEDLAKHGATAFLLCIAPLLIEGGTGSPVNPIAVV